MNRQALHKRLKVLRARYNCPDYIHPDPLEFVHRYSAPGDQEIVGLFAALIAYGRVAQILKSIELILDPMGSSPRDYLLHAKTSRLNADFGNFQHRWTRGNDIIHLAQGIQHLLQNHGSLESSFAHHLAPADTDTLSALSLWVRALNSEDMKNSLLSDPGRGSACKRLHLYLRWMIRSDEVDPGPWTSISPSLLVIPLDTHMFKVAKAFHMTRRKNPDGRAALDMTRVFRRMEPDDPLKFDFALTRLGIRSEMDLSEFCKNPEGLPGDQASIISTA